MQQPRIKSYYAAPPIDRALTHQCFTLHTPPLPIRTHSPDAKPLSPLVRLIRRRAKDKLIVCVSVDRRGQPQQALLREALSLRERRVLQRLVDELAHLQRREGRVLELANHMNVPRAARRTEHRVDPER